jgi:hypothetical protein
VTDALALLARIEADLSELRRLLSAEPQRAPEQWLSTGEIAQRLCLSKSRVAALCRAAERDGLPGVRKDGPRLWRATPQALCALMALRGAR